MVEAQVIVVIIFVLGLSFYGIPRFLESVRRQTAIARVKSNLETLTTWQYTPAEWRYAAQENFKLRPKEGDSGQVSFTPQYIYISSGKKDVLWEIVGENKYEKHLTEIFLHKSSPMNYIKFEVRQKIIRKDQDRNETEKCDSEEFYVSIPYKFETETDKVLKFYENILDNNADAVAAVMPYGLGMFGR